MTNSLLYVITIAVWGSTWLAIEFQLGVVPPEVSIFYRYSLAALLLFAWCAARGLRLRFRPGTHLTFALLGLLLFSLNYVFAYHAQRYITSALTAISFSMMVWMNIANARMFFGVRSGRSVVFGALLGVVGIGVMFSPAVTSLSLTDATVFGAALSMLGAYVASLGNMVSQAAQRRRLPVIQSNAWGMFYGALFTGAIARAQGHGFVFDWSVAYVGSLLYLVMFGSIVGFGAYLTLLGRIGAHKAGYVVILFPCVALVLSMLFEGLEPTAPIMIGGLLALAGNFFVMRRDRPKSPVHESAPRAGARGAAGQGGAGRAVLGSR